MNHGDEVLLIAGVVIGAMLFLFGVWAWLAGKSAAKREHVEQELCVENREAQWRADELLK